MYCLLVLNNLLDQKCYSLIKKFHLEWVRVKVSPFPESVSTKFPPTISKVMDAFPPDPSAVILSPARVIFALIVFPRGPTISFSWPKVILLVSALTLLNQLFNYANSVMWFLKNISDLRFNWLRFISKNEF